jgi:hypothetical protein
MSKSILEHNRFLTKTLHRDAHDPDKHYVHTVFHDDDALEKNKHMRLRHGLERGAKILDDREVIQAFSVPPWQWQLFKAKHPDIALGLHSKDEGIRERAAMQLKLLKPEWVVTRGGVF